MNKVDIRNKKFSRLTVLSESGKNKKGSALWLCKCDCGKTVVTVGQRLRSGGVKSCGCYKIDLLIGRRYKHGLSHSRFNKIYKHLASRCENVKDHAYARYGGRGVKNTWKNFSEFKEEMYESYLSHVKDFGEKQTTIDRINNNGNYIKSNCRWATYKEQANNRRPKLKK